MNNSSAINSTQQLVQCSIANEMHWYIQHAFSLVCFIGNVLVILCVSITPGLRNSVNCYIVNMAISDLLYIFITGPLFRIMSLVNVRTSIEILLCKIFQTAKSVVQFVSVESLVLITMDRYIATVKPLHAKKVTTRKRATLILLTWLLPVVVVQIPLGYYSRDLTTRNVIFCSFKWSNVAIKTYGRVIISIYYFVPLTLITVLYSRILKTLKTRPRPGNELQGNANLKRLHQHKSIMKILVSIVSAYFLCWTPYTVYVLTKMSVSLTDFHKFSRDTCFIVYIAAISLCPLLSTAINPTILFTFGSKYREALKNLFSRFSCKLRPRS